MIGSLLVLASLAPASLQRSAPRRAGAQKGAGTFTLRVGEGLNFRAGRVTRLEREVDFVFRYGKPERSGGMRVDPYTNGITYVPGATFATNYPVLEGARLAPFRSAAAAGAVTMAQVEGWPQREHQVTAGYYIGVRALTTGAHYLLRIHSVTGVVKDPKTWRLVVSYRPLTIRPAANAGIAVAGRPGGTLTFHGGGGYGGAGASTLLDVDAATGRATPRPDGRYPARAAGTGEYAYVDGAGRIAFAGADGKPTGTIPAPRMDPELGSMSGIALSADGKRVAVAVVREDGYVAVLDRGGREIAAFKGRHHPVWLADGRLLMAGYYGRGGLAIASADLRGVAEIPAAEGWDVRGLAASPDGTRLALEKDGRVWVCGPDGSGLRPLSPGGQRESSPAWSPDGKWVAVRRSDGMISNSVVVVRAADGKAVPLVDTDGNARTVDGPIVWR